MSRLGFENCLPQHGDLAHETPVLSLGPIEFIVLAADVLMKLALGLPARLDGSGQLALQHPIPDAADGFHGMVVLVLEQQGFQFLECHWTPPDTKKPAGKRGSVCGTGGRMLNWGIGTVTSLHEVAFASRGLAFTRWPPAHLGLWHGS
jgi:hypothetical protein